MKKINKLGLGILATLAIVAAAPLHAADDKYVSDPYGRPVKDPFGRCVLTIGGVNFPECSGEVAPPPPAQPTIQKLTLSADAFFDFNKSNLKPAGKASLNKLVSDLSQVQQVNYIDVVGHTDSVGSDSYNQRLSEKRSASVREYLVQQGVNPSIVRTAGQGERQPVASNDTAEGRAQNRRVEITIEAAGQ